MMNLFCVTCILLWATYPHLTQAVLHTNRDYCGPFWVRRSNNENSNLENVALGKTAKVNGADAAGSGRYNLPVSVAVNGVKDDDYCCVESNQYDYTPSLTVDLGQTYNISFITIYRRYAWTIRMVGMAIFVDDELCDVIDEEEALGDNSSLPYVTKQPVPITIYCKNSPVIGSVVTLAKKTTRRYHSIYFPYLINICEIEVWAKNPGFPSKSDAGKVLTTSTITPEKTRFTSMSDAGKVRTPPTITREKINARSTHKDTHVLTVSLGVGTIIVGFCLLCLVVLFLVWFVCRDRKESCSDGKSGGGVNPVFYITKNAPLREKDLC
ncbi:uncharacterized protein [Littorina saxatilis]|uniref:uncharacterized protein isoform X2 n=1 Tax=Littorina saxatilis TaxID=31220 RepID=UPI0038B6746B